MEFQLNTGDLYAILTSFCWATAVILFQLSGRILGSMHINVIKNTIGVIFFILFLIILSLKKLFDLLKVIISLWITIAGR